LGKKKFEENQVEEVIKIVMVGETPKFSSGRWLTLNTV
jgi:hypothetical protein